MMINLYSLLFLVTLVALSVRRTLSFAREQARVIAMEDHLELSDEEKRKSDDEKIKRSPETIELEHMGNDRPYNRAQIDLIEKDYTRKDVREAIKAAGVRSTAKRNLLYWTYFFLFAICFTITLSLRPLWFGIVTMILTMALLIMMMILIGRRVRFPDFSKAGKVLRSEMAKEAASGKRLLPDEFDPPKWVEMKRGLNPILPGDLKKIRFWTGKNDILPIVPVFGFMVLSIPISVLSVITILENDPDFPLGLAITIPVLSCFAVILLLGMPFWKQTDADTKLKNIQKWEEVSGRKVLPRDVQRKIEQMEDKKKD
jgi:hypothetical protein